MTYEDATSSKFQHGVDPGRNVAEKAGQAVKDGYKAAQQFAEEKGLNLDLGDFVRREPWLAIAAAFAIGYVAARIIRRVS
jgi:ElaB/YqjD/DUF883 family membrane-anchored ribosome-binding protein